MMNPIKFLFLIGWFLLSTLNVATYGADSKGVPEDLLEHYRGMARAYVTQLSSEETNRLRDASSEEEIIQGLAISFEKSHSEAEKNADEGFKLYMQGKYADAVPLLKSAAEENHPYAQELYADICLRGLDDEPHSYLEAAMWYVLSSRAGNPDVTAYIEDVVPNITHVNDLEEQSRALALYWVVDETLKEIGKVHPRTINDFLLAKRQSRNDSRGMGKVQAQKYPYLVERVVSAIFKTEANVIDDTLTVEGEAGLPPPRDGTRLTGLVVRSDSTCAEEARIIEPFSSVSGISPYCYGPVYANYLKELNQPNRVTSEYIAPGMAFNFIVSTEEDPHIHPVLASVIDTIDEVDVYMGGASATDLTNLTHRDPPWLWAGIRFWENYNKRDFELPEAKEALMRTLGSMLAPKPIPLGEDVIDAIRKKVDSSGRYRGLRNEVIWPREPNSNVRAINQEYNELMRKFFLSSLAKEATIENIVEIFLRKLEVFKSIELDFSSQDVGILSIPYYIHHCTHLVLRNLHSDPQFKHFEVLQSAQQYFVDPDLTLEISLSSDFNSATENGRRLIAFINKLKERSITVNCKDL